MMLFSKPLEKVLTRVTKLMEYGGSLSDEEEALGHLRDAIEVEIKLVKTKSREEALKEAAKAQCPYCKQERELLKPERALIWLHQPGAFGKETIPCWSTHIQDLLHKD